MRVCRARQLPACTGLPSYSAYSGYYPHHTHVRSQHPPRINYLNVAPMSRSLAKNFRGCPHTQNVGGVGGEGGAAVAHRDWWCWYCCITAVCSCQRVVCMLRVPSYGHLCSYWFMFPLLADCKVQNMVSCTAECMQHWLQHWSVVAGLVINLQLGRGGDRESWPSLQQSIVSGPELTGL